MRNLNAVDFPKGPGSGPGRQTEVNKIGKAKSKNMRREVAKSKINRALGHAV
jgi:hypothetical protein